jgi:hypothetical protein
MMRSMAQTAVGRTNQPHYPTSGSGNQCGDMAACPALLWVRLTGQPVDLREEPWLRGAVGEADGIGAEYFSRLARKSDQIVRGNAAGSGLTPDFDDLRAGSFDPARVDPRVREFYEHTADYRLDLWSYWCRCVRPFGWLMNALYSRRLQQLNLPISPLEPSRGITSEIIQLCDRQSGEVRTTGWLRKFNVTSDVIYAGIYSTAQPPNAAGPCVKVVFPLPHGSASVFLKPVVKEDGSLVLLSSGRRFGDPGFYLTLRRDDDRVWVKYITAMKESIHVYVDNRGDLRTDHVFRLYGCWFLKLHYSIIRRVTPPSEHREVQAGAVGGR